MANQTNPGAPDAVAACDECDTAFVVLNLCDGLTPQARGAMRKAWARVQEVLAHARPQGEYQAAIREPQTAASIQRYIDRGGVSCLACGSHEIVGDGVEIDVGVAQQKIRCLSCGSSWWDVYHLAEVANFEKGGLLCESRDR